MTRAGILLSIAALASTAASADPLPVTDQNPLLSGYGGSTSFPARIDADEASSFETAFAWGNSAIVQATASESLIVDAETKEVRLVAQRGFGERYALRVQLPYRHMSAGSLDGFIDRWHDTFGLPEGVRPSLPEDALRVFYRREGTVQIDARTSTQGFGDASVEVGRSLVATANTHVSGWASLKLPTGDADDFTGSGSVDATVAIAAAHRFDERWQLFGQVAGTRLGQGERLSGRQRDWLASAMAGISARTFGNLVLTLQVDAHSAVYDTDELDFLGDTIVLSVGGSYRFASDWALTLGVSEDIAVETAPDVVFLFDFKKTF